MEPNLECHVGDVQRCARETQESLTRLRVHEESPDGAVQIVLTATGRLDRITLRPWALRLGAERLAGVIAETIQRAHHAAGDQVEAALRPLLRWSHREVPFGVAFGDLVRAFRLGAGLSQDELAARSGLGVRVCARSRRARSPRRGRRPCYCSPTRWG